MRAVIALSLLAGCADFAGAEAEFCAEHLGLCSDAGAGGADGGVTRPTFIAFPQLSGFPQVGQTLVSSTGTWSSPLPISYVYSWFRCSAPDGGNCVPVLEGDAGYTLGVADLGALMRALVEAGNDAGVDYAVTAFSAKVRPLATLVVTGFEHGVANVPLNSLLITETSNVQMLGGAARSGRFGMRTQGLNSFIRAGATPGVTQLATRLAIRVQQPISAGTTLEIGAFEGTDIPTALVLSSPDGGAIVARLRHGSAMTAPSAVELQVGRWAVIRCALTSNVRCSVDDGPEMVEPSMVNGFFRTRLGTVAAGGPPIDFDDLAASDRASDHPIGDGETLGFAPTREGNHVRPTAFTWKADVASGVPDGGIGTAPLLADWPPRTSVDDWVAQTKSDTGASLEYELGDLPDQRAPTAVRVAIAASAGSSGPSRLIFVEAGGMSGPLFPPAGSIEYDAAALPRDPNGFPWSREVFDALTVRIGFSSDAGNQPRIEGLLFEAELPR